MNRRNIILHLMRKYQEFSDSITDPTVKGLVKKDGIITGGCIASLLLNEKVNDYDIYFSDKKTVLKVAQYYANQFIEDRKKEGITGNRATTPLVYTETAGIKNLNPNIEVKDFDRVRIMLKSSGIVGVDTKPKDYEYFETVESEEKGADFVNTAIGDDEEADLDIQELVTEGDRVDSEKLEEGLPKYAPLYFTDNAITLSGKIQIIVRFYGEPNKIHENFDYIHCTNYYIPNTNKLYLSKPAMESLLAKELKYVGSRYPVCSLVRLRKFVSRGWYINAGQILKIALQISKLDLEKISVLEDQLTGVDTAYFHELISKLKAKQEKDADFIPDMPYVVSLIERIFG